MLHRNFAVGLHAVPSRHPLALAVSASVAAHAALAVTLIGATAEMGRDREPDMVVDVDLDIAPAAPEGFDPLDRATTLVEEPAARADSEEAEETGAPEKPGEPTASALEPAPDEAKEKEQRKKEERERREKARREQREREEKERAEKEAAEEAERAAEAERGANQTDRDAGPDDAPAALAEGEAALDAGTTADGELAAATASSTSASTSSSTESGGGPPNAAAGIAPAGGAGEPSSIALPPGATADLRTYAPPGDKVAVLVRYDRLRGTPWAALADAIIAPMPDYRSIIGNRKVALADLFQSLLISSRNPTNVIATNLVARTHLGAAEVRRFLDHPLQRVIWQVARGGLLGKRESSELKLERDHRIYFMPFPGLVVLTAPRHLGVLAEPAAGPNEPASAGAAESELPAWLARARSVENEAGVDSRVIAVVTVGGLRAAELQLPELGVLPTPERFSLALEMAPVGFYVRGTLAFASPELAEQFENRLKQGRERLLASRFSQVMLQNLHALHALQGVTLRRRGSLVTYATSISNADAKAGMGLAAEWARRFFEVGPAPAETPAPTGASPSANAAAGNAPSGGKPVPSGGKPVPRSGQPAPGGNSRAPGGSKPEPTGDGPRAP